MRAETSDDDSESDSGDSDDSGSSDDDTTASLARNHLTRKFLQEEDTLSFFPRHFGFRGIRNRGFLYPPIKPYFH